MKVIKKWWKAATAVLASAVLVLGSGIHNGTKPVSADAETAVEPLKIASVGTQGTVAQGTIANYQLHAIAMYANQAGARFVTDETPTANLVGSTYAEWDVMKFYIGDFAMSDGDRINIKIVNYYVANMRFYLVDSDGDDIYYNLATSNSGTMQAEGASTTTAIPAFAEYYGADVPASKTVTISLDKASFSTVNKDGGSISENSTGEFNWNEVRYLKLATRTTGQRSSYDIVDINVNGASKFDMENNVMANSLAEVDAANEWAVGIPEYGAQTYSPVAYGRSVKAGDFEYHTTSANNNTVRSYWMNSVFAGSAYNETLDMSAYDALTFDVDTTTMEAGKEFKFEIKLNAGTVTAPVWYTANALTNYYILENPAQGEARVLEDTSLASLVSGVKAKVVIPFENFRKDGDSSSILNANDGELLKTIPNRLLFVTNFSEDMIVNVSNVQMIADSDKVIAKPQALDAVDAFAETFETYEGAWVRLSDGGIRFGAKADEAQYTALKAAFAKAGIEYRFGTLIVPNEAAYENAMPGGVGVLDIPQTENGVEVIDGEWNFYAAMVNIKTANYQRDFTSKAYLSYTVDGTTYTVFAKKSGEADDYVRNVYELAVAARTDGKTSTALSEILNYVEGGNS